MIALGVPEPGGRFLCSCETSVAPSEMCCSWIREG